MTCRNFNYYAGYGITIKSEIEFSFLQTQTLVAIPDLIIECCDAQPFISKMTPVNLGIKTDETSIALTVPGIAIYVIREGWIGIDPAPKSDQNSVQAFLFSAALKYYQVFSGKTILIGTAITFDDESAILYLGNSIDVRVALSNGARIIADGYVVIYECNARMVAEPGFPVIKLWEKEAADIGLDLCTLQLVRNGIKRYYFDMSGQFCDRVLPIQTINIKNFYPLKIDPPIKSIKGLQKLKRILPFQITAPIKTVAKGQAPNTAIWMKLVNQIECMVSANPEKYTTISI